MSEIININDRVSITIDADIVYGTIEDMYPSLSGIVYMVRLDNKSLVKLLREQFTLVQEDKYNPDTITINREEFRKVMIETTSALILEETKDPKFNTMLGLMSTLIGLKLETKLFDKASND